MKKSAKIPVAFLLVMLLFLAVTVMRKKPEARSPTTPFVPPGWVGPNSPPPTVK